MISVEEIFDEILFLYQVVIDKRLVIIFTFYPQKYIKLHVQHHTLVKTIKKDCDIFLLNIFKKIEVTQVMKLNQQKKFFS